MRQGRWSTDEDAKLRLLWGECSASLIVVALGRPRSSIANRAHKLRLDAQRCFTDDEKNTLRELWATHSAPAIAAKLFGNRRTASAVYALAHKLGLPKKVVPVATTQVKSSIRGLHAKGMNDAEIARKLGIERRTIRDARVALGLPVNVASVKAAGRRAVRRQLQTLGLSSPTELRTRAYALYAVENGWDADLRPREVQILNALATHGPLTMLQLAEIIGMRTDRIGANGRPALLIDSGRDGTYTASLMKRGLILYLRRHAKRRQCGLYCLSAAAVSRIEQRQEKNHAELREA